MKRKLWAHQKYAIDKYKDRPYFGLIFDTGMGKTLTGAQIAEAKNKPVLIIAPNALCKQWEKELKNQDEETRITNVEWEVARCTSLTKHTKKFKRALEELCQE